MHTQKCILVASNGSCQFVQQWAIKPQIRILSTNYEGQKYRTISKHFPSNNFDVVLGSIIM